MGKGSGSHVEKVLKLSPITDELGGDLSRANGCVEEVFTCDFQWDLSVVKDRTPMAQPRSF